MGNLRKFYDIPQEEFCRVWEESNSVQEAAERLNMPPRIVSARASRYRTTYGIKLKEMSFVKSNKIKAINLQLKLRQKKLLEDGQKSPP